MTLGLHDLDPDKIIAKVNRVTDAVVPQMYSGVPEFTIIGYSVGDAEQVRDALRPRLDSRLHVNLLDTKTANNLSIVRGRTRAGVLIIGAISLSSAAIQAYERSLLTACHCMMETGQVMDPDDLLMNMKGERFYKKP